MTVRTIGSVIDRHDNDILIGCKETAVIVVLARIPVCESSTVDPVHDGVAICRCRRGWCVYIEVPSSNPRNQHPVIKQVELSLIYLQTILTLDRTRVVEELFVHFLSLLRINELLVARRAPLGRHDGLCEGSRTLWR